MNNKGFRLGVDYQAIYPGVRVPVFRLVNSIT